MISCDFIFKSCYQNQNFNLLSELAKYIPKQNLDLQCPEICVGLELSSVTAYIPIISLQKTHYIQTIPDTKKRDVTYLAEKHDVKVDLLDISRLLKIYTVSILYAI